MVSASTRSQQSYGLDLLRGYLLGQIVDNPTHGYGLKKLLPQELNYEATAIYRALRSLEVSGFVTSVWGKSTNGPQRRIYKITESGCAELSRICKKIKSKCDEYDHFLEIYSKQQSK